MTDTFAVRRLGSTGIITDISPTDIEDPAVFTAGVNVRFRNGRVSRAPAARTVTELPFEPRHCFTIPPASGGYDEIIAVSEDFDSFQRFNSPAFEDLTPTGHVGSVSPQSVVTSALLGGVAYVNRETHHPLYKAPADTEFSEIPDWDPLDKCRVLRPYKDQLIALGVTKSGIFYPTMVKWSDISGFGAPPASWDPTLTTNSAGENIVNDMQHMIVDGHPLRDSFILYCTNSVWTMDFVGGDLIFTFRKIFDEYGVINPNCVAQKGAQHFVFDHNDIYVHDGVSPQSIADQRTREFIFDSIDLSKKHLCFVDHDKKLSEVRFCYPSSDRLVGFGNPTTGCNRAAIYNYANNTWSFDDIPNVVSSCTSAILSAALWEDDPEVTWDGSGGLYASTDGDETARSIMLGRTDTSQGLTAPRIYVLDVIDGGKAPYGIEPEAIKPVFLERSGLDLDNLGKNLNQYAYLQELWPQMSAEHPEDIYWQFGSTDLINREPLWSEEMPFDPETEGKLDINESGKYLSYRFGLRGSGDFKLSGFDVQMVFRGRR